MLEALIHTVKIYNLPQHAIIGANPVHLFEGRTPFMRGPLLSRRILGA